MKTNPSTASLAADAHCANDIRRDLLAALDDVSGALRACCPHDRCADAGDLMLVKSRAEAAAYRLQVAAAAICAHINREAE